VAKAHAATRRRDSTGLPKSEVWGNLMARVSHDLRTPLNAVIGFSDVMDAELLGPVGHPRYREYARHIRDCGRELLKSAEDTLAITSLLAHTGVRCAPLPLDLESLAADAWGFFALEVERRSIRFELAAPSNLELLGERIPLRQILVNLFAEAIDRAGDQGMVTLAATVDGENAQIEIAARGPAATAPAGPASLPVSMARALLDLHGTTLIEMEECSWAWRAVTVLRAATQPDFFTPRAPREEQPVLVC
jgi:K+-sensing histidine kinase KdpD